MIVQQHWPSLSHLSSPLLQIFAVSGPKEVFPEKWPSLYHPGVFPGEGTSAHGQQQWYPLGSVSDFLLTYPRFPSLLTS